MVAVSGGPTRARIVLVLGSVLALSSADAATVGAAAVQLRNGLHIGNTDIGLLVAVTSAVGAVFSLPFGVLADRARRTWILGFAIVIWGVAMIWGATATTSCLRAATPPRRTDLATGRNTRDRRGGR